MARGARPGVWVLVSLTARELEMPPHEGIQPLRLVLLLWGHLGPHPSPLPTQGVLCPHGVGGPSGVPRGTQLLPDERLTWARGSPGRLSCRAGGRREQW